MAITLNSVVCPGCAKQLDVDNKGCPHCGYEDNVRGRILPIGELIQLPSPEIGRANRFNDVCPAFLASIVSATRAGNASAQAESGETGPTAGEQVTILANAIGEFLAQIGMVFAKSVLSQVKVRTDPRRYNGALLVGLNGIVVKSHGSADANGFASAIKVAVDLARSDYSAEIALNVQRLMAISPQLDIPGSPETGVPA